MGLSASQARFLMLTGQSSDLEYAAQQICYQRSVIAAKSAAASKTYTDAINTTALFFRDFDNKEYSLTYSTLTAPVGSPGLGMYLTNNVGKKIVANASDIPVGANRKDYIIDNHLSKADYFNKVLKDGIYFITQGTEENVSQKTIAEIPLISEQYDTVDDAKAEAQYNQTVTELESEDKKLEMQLDEIETKREAIQTEMESVQKVVEKNIQTTFNIFS